MAASLKAAIQQLKLSVAQTIAVPGVGDDADAHGPVAAPVAGTQGSGTPAGKRRRRTFADSRTLKGNSHEPLKHGVTQNSGRASAKSKLRGKAKSFGIEVLPGDGTLTLATRHLPGGKQAVLGYIRLAAGEGDVEAKTWLHVWDSLKKYEQAVTSLDDICAASGISPVKLLKAIVGVAYEANCDAANLVAAHLHPEVVASSAKWARYKDGAEDRKMLLQHHGFIPTPKGTTINIATSANAQAANVTSADSSVPSFLSGVEATELAKSAVQKQLVEAYELPPTKALDAPDPAFLSKPVSPVEILEADFKTGT